MFCVVVVASVWCFCSVGCCVVVPVSGWCFVRRATSGASQNSASFVHLCVPSPWKRESWPAPQRWRCSGWAAWWGRGVWRQSPQDNFWRRASITQNTKSGTSLNLNVLQDFDCESERQRGSFYTTFTLFVYKQVHSSKNIGNLHLNTRCCLHSFRPNSSRNFKLSF